MGGFYGPAYTETLPPCDVCGESLSRYGGHANCEIERLRGYLRDAAYGLRHQPEISREEIAEMLERMLGEAGPIGKERQP